MEVRRWRIGNTEVVRAVKENAMHMVVKRNSCTASMVSMDSTASMVSMDSTASMVSTGSLGSTERMVRSEVGFVGLCCLCGC